MSIKYQVLSPNDIYCIKELCNELMTFQKSKAHIHPEFFDDMCFETRLLPSIKSANANHILAAIHDDTIIGYAYSTVAAKNIYSGGFATLQCDAFFDFDSVKNNQVGCLSQFYIKDNYRNMGIGSILFDKSMAWLNSNSQIDDVFIFVSNGNNNALKFYQSKGFSISHFILDGFITVLRNI